MRAKDFFRSVIRAERELMMLRAQIAHFRDVGTSISGGSMDGCVVTHSRTGSRVESAAMGIYDATKKLEDQAKEYSKVIVKAQKVISLIPQDKYRQILTLRYLSGWSFRSISDELRYNDPKSVYRAHGWALAAAQRILNREEEHGLDAVHQGKHKEIAGAG